MCSTMSNAKSSCYGEEENEAAAKALVISETLPSCGEKERGYQVTKYGTKDWRWLAHK